MIESLFALAFGIWLIRLGRKVRDLANDDPVTTYRIGKN